MGVPKQRWTSEEEAALRAGVARHGVGNWRTILKDPEFSTTLCYRSNVDLKDKWRNMNVIFTASSSREKGRTGVKKTRPTPKSNDQLMAVSTVTSDADEEIVDVKPVASVSAEAWNNPKKSNSRLDNVILEAIKNLKEPTGSHRTTIANYIEEQYWPPSDFDHLLSAKLKDLTTSGKLIKVNRKYRIAPSSPYSEGRSPRMLLLEDVQREPFKGGSDDIKTLTRAQVDADLARMATMTAEEAAAAAARAVAEAEAIMAEAEAAAREAEAAEAEAQAAQAFAEAAVLTLKNRNAAKLPSGILEHHLACCRMFRIEGYLLSQKNPLNAEWTLSKACDPYYTTSLSQNRNINTSTTTTSTTSRRAKLDASGGSVVLQSHLCQQLMCALLLFS